MPLDKRKLYNGIDINSRFIILYFHHTTKCSLAERRKNFISILNAVSSMIY